MPSQKVMLIGLDGANPSLLAQYVDEGALPHFAWLMERGVFAVNQPSIPANTPVNWTGMATGAHPGTHGITDYWLHMPGDPLDKTQEVFRSDLVNAEQIWDTAEKAGKRAMVMNYPCAYPSSMERGIFVGGEGAPESGSIFEVKSPCCFVSEGAADGTERTTLVHFTGKSPAATISLAPSKAGNPRAVTYTVRLVASEGDGYDCVEVLDVEGTRRAFLQPREWSDWLSARFVIDDQERVGRFRFYLSELSPDGQRFKLYASQIFPESGFTKPDEIGLELVETVGPYLEYCGAGPYRRGWHDAAAWFEEMRYKGLWMAEAASYLMNKYDCDLFYSHFHMLDHVFHYLWGGFDPLTGWYDSDHSAEYEKWILEAHKIADDMLGIFVEQAERDTTFVVVSDHGLIPHVKSISINNLFAREGLISCEPGLNNEPIVNWDSTFAYKPTDAAHIWINLKGRDPQGIVDQVDYEDVQERIINVLLNLEDPENGERPVALALKKRDAALFGLWGERTGDVIFMMSDAYSASLGAPLSNDGRVIVQMGPAEEGKENFHAPDYQSYHGCTLPTNEMGRGGSEAGMFLASGPAIKEGIRRQHPVRVIDVAPTVAHLLGIPQPDQAEGRILFDIFAL